MQNSLLHIRRLAIAFALVVAFVVCGLLAGCAPEQEQPVADEEPAFKTELIDDGVLKVLVPLDYPPFSAGEVDAPWGYDIAVAEEVANRLGVAVEFIPSDRATIIEVLACEPSLASSSTPSGSKSEEAGSSSEAEASNGAQDTVANDAENARAENAEDDDGAHAAGETQATDSQTPDTQTSDAVRAPDPVGDIAIAAMAITGQRDELVDFTSWYYVGNQAVVARKGTYESTAAIDPEKTRIAVVAGSTCRATAESLTAESLIAEYSSARTCLQALAAKEVQAVVLDLPVAEHLLANEFSDLRIIERVMTGEAYGIAVPADLSNLKDAINEALAEMEKDGTLARLEQEYLKRSY